MTKDRTEALDAQARAILRGNDRGGYTVPTAGLYPYQWNWDSAFAAWGFAEFDIDRAWRELECLASGQWANGMFPHILFHKPDPGYFPGPEVWGGTGPVPSSGISQPPVAASFARRIHEADPAEGARRLPPLLPRLARWHRWFLDWRLDAGAVCIAHPWEAGRDNAPDWDGAMAALDPLDVGPYQRRDTSHVDPAMRPTKYDYDRYIWLVQQGRRLGWDEARLAAERAFFVADPTMTFLLLRAQRDLEWLAAELGEPLAGLDGAVALLEEGAAGLWNPEIGAYDARDALTGRFAGSLSNASFLCWWGGVPPRGMAAQFDRVMGLVPHGMPSHDPASPKFDARRYWRGPTWGILNALIGMGLAERGEPARADRLRRVTRELIATHGFAEYFDPLTGSPAGGGSFTWTAAVWLAWASPTKGA